MVYIEKCYKSPSFWHWGILNNFPIAVSKTNHLVSTCPNKFLVSLPRTDESLVVVLEICLYSVHSSISPCPVEMPLPVLDDVVGTYLLPLVTELYIDST